jgi:hypothetical protein
MKTARPFSSLKRSPFALLLSVSLSATAAAQDPAASQNLAETPETAPPVATEKPAGAEPAPQDVALKETTTDEEEEQKAPITEGSDPVEKPLAPEKSEASEQPKVSQQAATITPQAKTPPPPKIDYSKLPWTYHQKRFDLGAGLLVSWVSDPAFDLFQSKNAYPAWEARAAVGLWASGPLSFAVTAKFNNTSIEGEVRTLPSFLGVSRLHVGGEARYHLVPRAYAYGRLDLGAFLARSRLGEADANTRMELEEAGVSGVLSVGSAVRVAGSPDGRTRAPRLHLFVEGGVEYDSPLTLTFEMVSEGALRPAPVELGTLSLGGPRIALGALVSY